MEIVRRAIGSNRGNPYGQALDGLLRRIRSDQETLRRLMSELGVSENRVKQLLAWTLEKAGRLKPNGRLVGYSPLSRLVELETLSLGVEASRRFGAR